MSWREALRPVSTSSCSPASRARAGASPIPTRRRPGWRCRASTPRSGAAASWCSARARSGTSSRSTPRRATRRCAGCTPTTFPRSSSPRGSLRRWSCRQPPTGTAVPLLRTRSGTPDAMARLGSALDNLLAPRTTIHGVLMDILGPGRARHRRERHRQERVRARPGRARPSAGGRRRGGAALPRRVVRARQLSRADPPSHGDPRPRADQHPGPLRRRLDAHVEAGRAGRPARTLGAGPRVRSPRSRRCALRRDGRADPDDPHAGGPGPQHRHPGRGGGAQPAAAHARRACGAGAGRSPDPGSRGGAARRETIVESDL